MGTLLQTWQFSIGKYLDLQFYNCIEHMLYADVYIQTKSGNMLENSQV